MMNQRNNKVLKHWDIENLSGTFLIKCKTLQSFYGNCDHKIKIRIIFIDINFITLN